MNNRIGFACKYSIIDRNEIVSVPEYNTKTTTVAWLNRQSKDIAEQRLFDIVKHNLKATKNIIKKIGTLDELVRCIRLSSDILPVYTHPDYNYFYKQRVVEEHIRKQFAEIGHIARGNSVRLSVHPGQYCVLASDREEVVKNSIADIEYHADMARYMGYGTMFHDHGFKINVHISGKKGVKGFKESFEKLSDTAKNLITVENEEISYGIDDCLELADIIPVVLDIHHHWIHSGKYIDPNDDRIKKVINSWQGIRPIIHYSISREEVLVNHDKNVLPDFNVLNPIHKKQKLRAHSDFMWNSAVNNWALTHLDWADIMVESKAKNLASFKLAELVV